MVFKPSHPTGISGTPNVALSVYPNPASEGLQLTGVSTGAAYQILDLTGRRIQDGTVPADHRLAIKELAGGSYLLQLSDESNNRQTLRFTKQ
jgi:hypothetical protein